MASKTAELKETCPKGCFFKPSWLLVVKKMAEKGSKIPAKNTLFTIHIIIHQSWLFLMPILLHFLIVLIHKTLVYLSKLSPPLFLKNY